MQLDMAVSAAKPDNDLEILIRRLTWYRNTHADIKIRELADGLIDVLKNEDLRKIHSHVTCLSKPRHCAEHWPSR